MGGQLHRIQREVIDLVVSNEAAAEQLQTVFSGLHEQRIAPVIDACLSESSAPDRIHRIDRLVVDLGVIARPDPAGEFLARLRPALRRSLFESISGLESSSRAGGAGLDVTSRIEILAVFGRTGQIPWWADTSDSQLVDGAIEFLAREGPRELVTLIRALRDQRSALQRIARHASDETLATLMGLLAEAASVQAGQGLPGLAWMIEESRHVPTADSTSFRDALWISLVQMLSGLPDWDQPEFWREALTRIALECRTPLPTLADALVQLAARRQGAVIRDTPLLTALEELRLAKERGSAVGEMPIGVKSWISEIAAILKQGALATPEVNQLVATLRQHADGVSAQDRRWLMEALQKLRSGEVTGDPAVATQLIRRVADRAVEEGRRATTGTDGLKRGEIKRAAFETIDADPAADLTFSDAGADYVENAGLVLVWPFLKSLFERRGLVEEDRFVEESARHRAAGLLSFLASGERAPAEYQVTLNKLLCGIDSAAVFDFGRPVDDEEAEECANLLMAAIGHAKILRDMSADGFRGTFLIRKGVVTAEAGSWLLRVERKTYDIVLDHFPWSREWVRFPWMEAPLRVEW